MHHGTPFFQGFSSILFGRPALSGVQKTLREVAALNTLSDFFETFGFLIPDALLRRRSSGTNSRQRRFTLHVTFWAFLAQTLAPETSCREIVRKVQAWWLLRRPKSNAGSSSCAAYTKARQRLEPETIRGIGSHLIERLEGRVQSSQLWLGRRVRVVDGTTVSMPDTPENQEKYPQPSSQKAGCGFPQMRVVGLFSLASGALLDFAKSSIHVHESILFGQLMSTLEKGDITLADRGFCSFHAFWKMSQVGVDALMRLNGVRKVDFRKGVKLGPNDRLITWKKPAQRPKGCTQEQYDALPASMTLRHVRLTVSARGHRCQTITLVTTLLDPAAYPLQQVGELYLQRWSVELHFREIKITLGMDVLRCQTPAMVEKEVMMHAVSYNLIRALMQEAAIRHQVDLTRISFKGTVDTLRHWSASIEAMRGMPRKQRALLDAMFELIAKDLVPLRPGREEPRAKKRRPKNYHLLTKPRRKMRIRGHRNRPKSVLS
jgi:hypothetical protein